MTDTIDPLIVLDELTSILNGENRWWTGNGKQNARYFLHQLHCQLPTAMPALILAWEQMGVESWILDLLRDS